MVEDPSKIAYNKTLKFDVWYCQVFLVVVYLIYKLMKENGINYDSEIMYFSCNFI
jgi:hypothetical protein